MRAMALLHCFPWKVVEQNWNSNVWDMSMAATKLYKQLTAVLMVTFLFCDSSSVRVAVFLAHLLLCFCGVLFGFSLVGVRSVGCRGTSAFRVSLNERVKMYSHSKVVADFTVSW